MDAWGRSHTRFELKLDVWRWTRRSLTCLCGYSYILRSNRGFCLCAWGRTHATNWTWCLKLGTQTLNFGGVSEAGHTGTLVQLGKLYDQRRLIKEEEEKKIMSRPRKSSFPFVGNSDHDILFLFFSVAPLSNQLQMLSFPWFQVRGKLKSQSYKYLQLKLVYTNCREVICVWLISIMPNVVTIHSIIKEEFDGWITEGSRWRGTKGLNATLDWHS